MIKLLKQIKINKLINDPSYDMMTITIDGEIVEYIFTKKGGLKND